MCDVAALELLEDLAELVLGDTDTGVPDFDRQALPMPAATEQDAPAGGVANGVAEQVTQDPREQLDVAAHQRRAGHEVQAQALAAGDLVVLGGEVFQQFADGEGRDIRFDHPGIQLGDIHQGAEQAFHVFQGVADVAHQGRAFGQFAFFQQRAGEQAGGVQGLQQVVADRGEEFGFRQVGLFGLQLGFAQA
ncbi:hypothetical protein D3C80_1423090 [compost metagenome]